jgi:3-dehydroquinate dehydratase-2
MGVGVTIGVLHGPNLNLLGGREPEVYGSETLQSIEERLADRAGERGVEIVATQSNSEGALIDWVQARTPDVAGWLVNAGGLTHTSVSLRDALVASQKPFVEVHLSNLHAREPFRARSLLADAAVGVVMGFRGDGYLMALDGLLRHLDGA